jgi:hypothetical protein
VLAIVLLVVGLVVGGAAGYFVGDLLIFSAERKQAAADKTALQQRVTQLEQQVATLQTGTGNTGTATTGTGSGTGTSTSGTGTAPTVGGITADPQTANWSLFEDKEKHFSFKYPSDYEVQAFQNSGDLASIKESVGLSDSDDFWFAIGIFKPGESTPAGLLRIYRLPPDGPAHRDLQNFKFIDALPTTTQGQAAGAGVAPKADETAISLNGTEGFQFVSVEGKGLDATPGGSTYTGHLFEEQFDNSYLTTYCDSDQTSQRNVVGCLWLTTFTILR